jgi:hypothetical protein
MKLPALSTSKINDIRYIVTVYVEHFPTVDYVEYCATSTTSDEDPLWRAGLRRYVEGWLIDLLANHEVITNTGRLISKINHMLKQTEEWLKMVRSGRFKITNDQIIITFMTALKEELSPYQIILIRSCVALFILLGVSVEIGSYCIGPRGENRIFV